MAEARVGVVLLQPLTAAPETAPAGPAGQLRSECRALDRLTKPRTVEQKTLKGINFFDPVDNALLYALQNPRVNIAGIRRADLLPLLYQLSPDRLSRQLRRLRDLGVIKRVAATYRYYLTRIGRAATAALCRVTQTVIIPALA